MFQSQVADLIRQHGLIPPDSVVIVAVSGGMDSVTLLHILNRLCESHDFQLHVASLDHGIRGEDGASDLAFVRDLARASNLAFSGGTVDVPALAKRESIGIESAARKARYDFLAHVAKQQGASSVAVAHHAHDQAETIMMHILRGAGLRGLRGMQLKSPLPGQPQITLIRPLLHQSREQIEAYAARHQLPFRHDASNDDLSLSRNFLRHKTLLPLLEREPALLDAFARLADSARVDEAFLDARYDADVLPQITRSDSRWSVPRTAFMSWHESLQRRFLRRSFEALADTSLSHAATIEGLRFIAEARAGKRIDLGDGIQLRLAYDRLHIESRAAPPPAHAYRLIPADTDIPLCAPADIAIGDLRLRLTKGSPPQAAGIVLRFPPDGSLRLRTRRPGDRFAPRGMQGHSRKLKDWMIDRKIPRALRSRIPLLCLESQVIAICLGAAWHLSHVADAPDCAGESVALLLD